MATGGTCPYVGLRARSYSAIGGGSCFTAPLVEVMLVGGDLGGGEVGTGGGGMFRTPGMAS